MKHLYFLGIGGSAMANVAVAMRDAGFTVSGSDAGLYPPMSTLLEEQGIAWFEGFSETHLQPAPDLVIVGNAMSRGNPELEYVLNHKLPYSSLAALVGEQFIAGSQSVVVSGTHGKTTTSSLIAWVLESAGKKPGFLIGGLPRNFDRGCRPPSTNGIFVSEGDEYDTAFFDKRSKFLHYRPDLLIVNNIEFDHADIFPDLDAILRSFSHCVAIVPGNGLVLVNGDDANALRVATQNHTPVWTFGLGANCDCRARNFTFDACGMTLSLEWKGEPSGRFTAPLAGEHNVRNVLATIAAGRRLGLSDKDIQEGLSSFTSVRRRLEIRADTNRAMLIDDFAHHPTAIAATLSTLRTAWPGRTITACFEPRSNTSTRRVFQREFVEALGLADRVVIGAVNRPGRYAPEEMLDVPGLIRDLTARDRPTHHFPNPLDIVAWLKAEPVPGEIIVLLSNGQFGGLADRLQRDLETGAL